MFVQSLIGILFGAEFHPTIDGDRLDRWLQVGPQIMIFFGLILLFLEIRSLRADLIRVFERLSQRD